MINLNFSVNEPHGHKHYDHTPNGFYEQRDIGTQIS